MFEHYILALTGPFIDQEKAMDQLGADGWELVAVTLNQDQRPTAYFKRRLP